MQIYIAEGLTSSVTIKWKKKSKLIVSVEYKYYRKLHGAFKENT